MPYDPAVPVVCIDEKLYQLLGEAMSGTVLTVYLYLLNFWEA